MKFTIPHSMKDQQNKTIDYITPGNTELSLGIISFFVATEDGEFAVINPLIPKGTHLVNDPITHVNVDHILVFQPTPGSTVIIPITYIKSDTAWTNKLSLLMTPPTKSGDKL